jgi:hypothetical protein
MPRLSHWVICVLKDYFATSAQRNIADHYRGWTMDNGAFRLSLDHGLFQTFERSPFYRFMVDRLDDPRTEMAIPVPLLIN